MEDTATLASVIGGVGAVVTGWFGYRLALRKAGGRIDTTDADALWREAGSLRGELQREIQRLNASLADARQTFELERHEWQQERDSLLTEIRSLKAEREKDDARIKELERELRARLDAARAHTSSNPPGGGL